MFFASHSGEMSSGLEPGSVEVIPVLYPRGVIQNNPGNSRRSHIPASS
jgi:hypothetical protein